MKLRNYELEGRQIAAYIFLTSVYMHAARKGELEAGHIILEARSALVREMDGGRFIDAIIITEVLLLGKGWAIPEEAEQEAEAA